MPGRSVGGVRIRVPTAPSTAPPTTPRPLWSMESFTVYDTERVGIELLSARVTITAPGEIAMYERAFTQLSTVAVYGAAARARIERARAACG
ncbi:Scr1 family TA system antitoxin-like transcriptional regulator [Streptomyces sp. G-G2]|uniref:Scr1 family TA system antitoxin-like transcriptional regulator n=1 Tax=Streptomyces sp. G-G2 TaxID=3046201 RepID=UPI0024BABE72|nr:Scr1 family TA system antitoxin-like transcriptional regulator [Streptomyces sp. G-G2]MDJ0384575.1 Scr1 family TA system antitoxin-like transcriptional regulator [Streptomyces sp. G-G2]